MDAHVNAALNSRAGDRFHYMWAARRCLKMIQPGSSLQYVIVEGSSDPKKPGELVIDLQETYSQKDSLDSIHYYQLKHSTVRVTKPSTLSELDRTLKGFALRHIETKKRRRKARHYYHYVSNRPVSDSIKNAISQIVAGENAPVQIVKKLMSVTGLAGNELQAFLSAFDIADQESGYLGQERELQFELSRLAAGTLEEGMTHRMLGLISDQALPKSGTGKTRGLISQVDVLKVFGVSNVRDLFPAPTSFEPLGSAFVREQHLEIVKQIVDSTSRAVIIHAEGGVGKTIVAQQIKDTLPHDSFGLVYDCFGGGNYRSPSQPRHRPRDALMQMANEMAVEGLCSSLIVSSQSASQEVFKAFMRRVGEACEALQHKNSEALLTLLIDAADNAEMAAMELEENGFAHLLIREKPPKNCRLVFLCRSGRRQLLHPPSSVLQIRLNAFTISETTRHLKSHFPNATGMEAKEFHRLTGGNPRIQSNCLAFAKESIQGMLLSLGRKRLSVDEQIGNQLQTAIDHLKDLHPKIEGEQIDAICRGLATLPPFIPIAVLAAAAQVDPATIVSFISDLGRPLWHSDQSVQFRDEPTETWFKETFAASAGDIRIYVAALEPLSATYTYAARSLPALWHQSGQHDKLITLALSGEFLPENNSIEAHEVRIYRLQFALKTALKAKRMVDAAKLALRAGEEMAGNLRQLELLENNTDLMATLQDAQIVQDCAYKRQLRGAWKGSEEVFAASLLAWNKDFQGEASNCLRTAGLWLDNYFQEKSKLPKNERLHYEELKRSEIAELGWACLGLHGPKAFCGFVTGWQPAEMIHEVTSIIVGRLVDGGQFEIIDSIARSGAKCSHLVLALCHELLRVSKLPPKVSLNWTLKRLAEGHEKLDEAPWDTRREPLLASLVSFSEACAFHKLSTEMICRVLEIKAIYVPSIHTITSGYDKTSRYAFAKALSLHAVLNGQKIPDVESLLPEPAKEAKEHAETKRERKDAKSILRTLIAVCEIRAKLFVRGAGWEELTISQANTAVNLPSFGDHDECYSAIDTFWDELQVEKLRIVALQARASDELKEMIVKNLHKKSPSMEGMAHRVQMMRIAYRQENLEDIGHKAEIACQQLAGAMDSPEPNQRGHWFVQMARAVLSYSKDDAAAYFVNAVEETSKFDDEITTRWDAVCSLARGASDVQGETAMLAYRFIRCAELVGISTDDEKHWDRQNVIRTLVYLHPASAFTGLSRWNERYLGRQSRLTESLFEEIARTGGLQAAACFAATGFIGPHGALELLEYCLKHETSKSRRQKFLDQFVVDLFRDGTLLDEQILLISLAAQYGLSANCLNEHLMRAERMRTFVQDQPASRISQKPLPEQTKSVEVLFAGCDLKTTQGLAKAVKMVCGPALMREFKPTLSDLLGFVPRGREAAFMQVVLSEQVVDYFDMRSLMRSIKEKWLGRAAVAREWLPFLQQAGRRYHRELSEGKRLSYFLKECELSEIELRELKKGILQQVEESTTLLHSAALFGFATIAVEGLPPVKVREVLAYALGRFEERLPPEFGDGPWNEWLIPPANVLDAYTGLIWASLGSPSSEIRWQAAHCVRRLVELDCQAEISSLLHWVDRSGIAAFLGKDFNFYEFHAKLHLLFGLARGALESPELLLQHVQGLIKLAKGAPHALIHLEASKLIQKIESAYPGSVPTAELQNMVKSVRSPFPLRVVDGQESFHSPWHLEGVREWPQTPSFGMDFEAYWLPSLCRVFELPLSELQDLMRFEAVETFCVSCSADYREDKRRPIWRSQNFDWRGTYHSHGDYPWIHDYHFYFAYHSLMIVAAKLMARMPILHRARWDEETDRWTDWIRRHQLVRDDGRWLSDRRDPTLPSRRPPSSTYSSDWLFEIEANDFYDVLVAQASIQGGLCIYGYWNDAESYREETISINCAFVLPALADSLATAARTANDVHFCSLRGILNTVDHSKQDAIFELIPIINHDGHSRSGLDDFDPYAHSLNLRPNIIDQRLIELFGLTHDSDERFWYIPGNQQPVLAVDIWSDQRESRHASFTRSGQRVFASVDLLKLACSRFGRSLVIDVEIRRSMERGGYEGSDFSRLPPSKKVFILDSNGILRDTKTHYQLGQATR
jgi:hypothetical protein